MREKITSFKKGNRWQLGWIARCRKIIVLDYGSQYNSWFRRIREIGVFLSSRATRLLQTRSVLSSLSGLSLSGGWNSVYEDNHWYWPEIFGLRIPILGICWHAMLTHKLGGRLSCAQIMLGFVNTVSRLYAYCYQPFQRNTWKPASSYEPWRCSNRNSCWLCPVLLFSAFILLRFIC